MKIITNIEQIKIGDSVIGNDDQICHILDINYEKRIDNKPKEKNNIKFMAVFSKFMAIFNNQHNTKKEITESVIRIQHYPNNKWYIANIKCDKCGGESKIKNTSKITEKFICSNLLPKEAIPPGQFFQIKKLFPCGGKKYTEIKRRYTGIKCESYILWSDFIKEYKLP